MLVADAFSGDTVPIQLMTLQAFKLYFSHLAAGGVLAVNVSNRFLNLAPVVARAAGALGKQAVRIEDPGEAGERVDKRSEWMLVTGNRRLAARLAHTPHGEFLDSRQRRPAVDGRLQQRARQPQSPPVGRAFCETAGVPRPFRQVDVFTATAYDGNPVAVVLDGRGLDDENPAAFRPLDEPLGDHVRDAAQ